jgi:hypothetical protein
MLTEVELSAAKTKLFATYAGPSRTQTAAKRESASSPCPDTMGAPTPPCTGSVGRIEMGLANH